MLESDCVPDIHDIIFTGGENNREVWVETYCRHIVGVTILIKGIQALLGLVVPHLHMPVIAP